MELKDFVAATITDIAQGIVTAQEKANGKYLVAPRHAVLDKSKSSAQVPFGGGSVLDCIDFDVAVTTTETLDGKASAKIVVIEGNLNTQYEVKNLSRVRFQVYVDWPHPSAP